MVCYGFIQHPVFPVLFVVHVDLKSFLFDQIYPQHIEPDSPEQKPDYFLNLPR